MRLLVSEVVLPVIFFFNENLSLQSPLPLTITIYCCNIQLSSTFKICIIAFWKQPEQLCLCEDAALYTTEIRPKQFIRHFSQMLFPRYLPDFTWFSTTGVQLDVKTDRPLMPWATISTAVLVSKRNWLHAIWTTGWCFKHKNAVISREIIQNLLPCRPAVLKEVICYNPA